MRGRLWQLLLTEEATQAPVIDSHGQVQGTKNTRLTRDTMSFYLKVEYNDNRFYGPYSLFYGADGHT
jgi:hypothetical protein